MINVCLIGYGEWGKKVFNSLKNIKQIKEIQLIKNRRDKTKINFKNLEWIFITTNVASHYHLVKKYLKKRINVFCEKPLTNSIKKDLELYKLAKKNKCRIYVSDIENYKKLNLKLRSKNTIKRFKFSKNKKNIFERLVYHDFTYLFKFLKKKKISKSQIIKKSKGKLSFKVTVDNKEINFIYDLNSKRKIHKFNDINLKTNKNILKDMLQKVILKKVNFYQNKKISLFSTLALNIVNK